MILLTCMNVIMYQMNVGVKWSNHVNSKMCRQRGAQPKSNFTKQDSLKMSLTIAFLLVMRNLAYIFCTLWSQLGIQQTMGLIRSTISHQQTFKDCCKIKRKQAVFYPFEKHLNSLQRLSRNICYQVSSTFAVIEQPVV